MGCEAGGARGSALRTILVAFAAGLCCPETNSRCVVAVKTQHHTRSNRRAFANELQVPTPQSREHNSDHRSLHHVAQHQKLQNIIHRCLMKCECDKTGLPANGEALPHRRKVAQRVSAFLANPAVGLHPSLQRLQEAKCQLGISLCAQLRPFAMHLASNMHTQGRCRQ